MKKIEFILFFGFCFLGISKAIYSQKQYTVVIKDSIAKMKLDKELIKLTKQVVLKHGPGYYREYKKPIIRYRRVTKTSHDLHPSISKKNEGRIYYTVEYPYDMKEEIFYSEYSAKVYFWEDLTIFDIFFGDGKGIQDYDKLSRAAKNKIVIPFKQRKPGKWVQDTIRNDKGDIIDIINRYEDNAFY